MCQRVVDYIKDKGHLFTEPTLVLALDNLEQNYRNFTDNMPGVNVHYALKANPHPHILKELVSYGSGFDTASLQEIAMCIDAGCDPKKISFGNTVKHPSAIRGAVTMGIDLFVADSFEELTKIADNAPGSRVYIRLLVRSTEAEWPLSRKFGCSLSMAPMLFDWAKHLGLEPVGLSFHVGSQTRHPHMWLDTLDTVEAVWTNVKMNGHKPYLLNIGGGFPAFYGVEITDPKTYGETLMGEINKRFDDVKYLMIEPGRAMVANLGAISAEVLLVSQKTIGDPVRWVYLEVGRFNGLAETEEEAIKYQISVVGKEDHEMSDCIVAGPTCDSADVLYEDNLRPFPVDLKCGDLVIVHNTGAYTMTYSTIAFNGFAPLRVMLI